MNDKPLIVLKIDVDTYRGTREGVPNLVRMLKERQAGGTFLFSLGPDHTGWALRRALRPGFFSKVSRTSVVEHYGLKTLMYGVLLPGPDIGKECATEMRAVQEAGFECGIHTWDHVLWQDNVAKRDAAWSTSMMRKAAARFTQIFGVAPHTHGAAGWQMNNGAFHEHDAAGYAYASDSRCMLNIDGTLANPGDGPHHLSDGAQVLNHIQMPTTLPTLDELLGVVIDGTMITTDNIASFLLKLTDGAVRDHVYTLHAELEGQKLATVFEQLLRGWQAQGYQLASMADYYQKIRNLTLPVLPMTCGELPGRSGKLMLAGATEAQ